MKKHLLSFLFIAISFVAFSQISLTINKQNATCFGTCNGSASVSIAGGTAPYTTAWSNGSVGPLATNLCSGVITATVVDASSVTATASITILEPSQINIFASANNDCGPSCSGSASVSVFGGTPAYSYTWSNGSTLTWVQNLCVGIYTVGVTDMNGCVAFNTVSVNQMPLLNISLSQTNTTCYSNCNGAASAIITNGTAPYTFQWLQTAAPTLTTPSINNLCTGNYTLIVQDATGCTNASSLNVISTGTISNLSATITPTNETCLQSGDGQINLALSGSNSGPFTYQWSNGATSQIIYNISSNSYWVEISDGTPTGCLSLQTNVGYVGINCGNISGNVYIDMNSDCIKNAGDNNAVNAPLIINPGNRIGYVNSIGNYTVSNLPYGTYSVSLNSNYGNFIPTCTQTITTNVNGGSQNSVNNNLSVGFTSSTNPDLKVSAYSNGIVPGFICYVNYNLSNLNNVSATGLFKAVLPSSFIANITTGNPNTYSISGDTIIWNFSNITFTTNVQFQINFTVPLITPLGSVFTTCMWAQPSITDFNYVDNTFCYSRQVTGSFDPNDKTVSPIGVGATGDIATSVTDLTYLIRFQNTGNGPAVNIVVKDTLSPNVDINTFEMLGSSHNYMIDVLPGNVLRWKFNNIMLPDSNSNESGSHGYIQYRIKRTNNNTPGTQIKNTAYIYFDFNEPVVTNTAINTIETITGIKSSFNTNDEWNVYPNPSTGALYIVNSSSVKEESQIQVINSIGQTVLEETITSNYKNMDLSKLNNGVYFMKILSDKHNVIKRVVLSK